MDGLLIRCVTFCRKLKSLRVYGTRHNQGLFSTEFIRARPDRSSLSK